MNNTKSKNNIRFSEGLNQFSPTIVGKIIYTGFYIPYVFVLMPYIITLLVSNLLDLITGKSPIDIFSIIELLFLAFVSVYTPMVLYLVMNFFPTIRVVEDGLMVRVFNYRYHWKYISWEDVLRVAGSGVSDDWREPLHFIQVKELSRAHLAFSKRINDGPYPVIILNHTIKNREKLVKIVHEIKSGSQKSVFELTHPGHRIQKSNSMDVTPHVG